MEPNSLHNLITSGGKRRSELAANLIYLFAPQPVMRLLIDARETLITTRGHFPQLSSVHWFSPRSIDLSRKKGLKRGPLSELLTLKSAYLNSSIFIPQKSADMDITSHS